MRESLQAALDEAKKNGASQELKSSIGDDLGDGHNMDLEKKNDGRKIIEPAIPVDPIALVHNVYAVPTGYQVGTKPKDPIWHTVQDSLTTDIFDKFCRNIRAEPLPAHLKDKYDTLNVSQCDGVTSPQNGKQCYNRQCFAYVNKKPLDYYWKDFQGILFKDKTTLDSLLESKGTNSNAPVKATICSRHAIPIPFVMLTNIMDVHAQSEINFNKMIFQLSVVDDNDKPYQNQSKMLKTVGEIKAFIDIMPDNERELIASVRHETTKVIRKRKKLDNGDHEALDKYYDGITIS